MSSEGTINLLDLHTDILKMIARMVPLQKGQLMRVSRNLQYVSERQPYVGYMSSLQSLSDKNKLVGQRDTIIIEGCHEKTPALDIVISLREALKVNGILASLKLHGTFIGSSGAKELAAALKINSVLTNLNLASNNLTNGCKDMSGIVALADALKSGISVLTYLNLAYNGLGAEGGEALAAALSVNGVLTKLEVGYNNMNEEAALAIVRAVRHRGIMTSLGLAQCSSIGPDGVKEIAEYVKFNGVLANLNLRYNRLDAEAGKVLADALSVNSVLKSIDLQGNSLGTEGWCAIFAALRNNTENKIESWNLDDQGINVEISKVLAEYVSVSGVLTNLTLRFNNLDAKAGKALADALSVNGVLTKLDVGYNNMNEEAALSIVRAARQHDRMSKLGLARCKIGLTGGKEIADYVSASGVLKKLNVCSNSMDDVRVRALRDAARGRTGFELQV